MPGSAPPAATAANTTAPLRPLAGMFVAAYVGARPLGRPLPALADAPQGSPSVPLHLIHAFARDAAKDGRFEFYGSSRTCGPACP